MAKKQKNALLDEGVCNVVDCLQRITGATFPRIVTAALLKYVFGPLTPPRPPHGSDPDAIWMLFAVEIEHGDCTIGEIPTRLFKDARKNIEDWIGVYHREKPSDRHSVLKKEWQTKLRATITVAGRWNRLVEDSNGERAAIQRVIQSGGFKTPSL